MPFMLLFDGALPSPRDFLHVGLRDAMILRSITEGRSGSGTRIATPSSLPCSSGQHQPDRLGRTVEVGIIEHRRGATAIEIAVQAYQGLVDRRYKRGSCHETGSMPTVSFSHFATGRRTVGGAGAVGDDR